MQKKIIKRQGGMKRISKMITFALFCLLTQLSLAQQNVVEGTVTDQNGNPLLGVNVIQKNTSNGTATDFDGNFQLNVPQDGILVFSFIGFETKEVAVDQRQRVDVVLSEDSESLDEVVLIGYGTQQRQDVNGSVSSIESDEIENIPQVSIDQLMQGRASGVTISQNSGKPGSAVSVRIRGITSITGNNEPLYVIDGVPISGDSRNTSTSGRTAAADFGGNGQTGTSPLAGLNPNDI